MAESSLEQIQTLKKTTNKRLREQNNSAAIWSNLVEYEYVSNLKQKKLIMTYDKQ